MIPEWLAELMFAELVRLAEDHQLLYKHKAEIEMETILVARKAALLQELLRLELPDDTMDS